MTVIWTVWTPPSSLACAAFLGAKKYQMMPAVIARAAIRTRMLLMWLTIPPRGILIVNFDMGFMDPGLSRLSHEGHGINRNGVNLARICQRQKADHH